MKKIRFAVLVCWLLVCVLGTTALAHGDYEKTCDCPESAGVTYTYPTYYSAINDSTHILLEQQLVHCAQCGAFAGRGSDVPLSDHEPHVFEGYECKLCGYWKLGTATMYDNTAHSTLRNASVGSIVTFGSYEQDGVYDNGSETIEWIVLDRRGSQVLLLSRYGLDAYPYHHTSTAVNWSSASVRAWLQSTFYNEAFSAEEQGMILTTHNATPVNSNNAGSPGPDTYDTVFFLSATEATNYLTTPESRMVKATSYALMRGASTNYSQNSYWWLRSYADASRQKVLMINSQGNVYASTIDDYGAVVRPAVWVEVE